MVKHTGDLVVRRRVSPAVRYGLIAASVVVAILGGAGLFWRGESVAGFYAGRAAHEQAVAKKQIAHLRQKVRKLSAELAMSKRMLQSGDAAYSSLSTALKKSDEQLMHLQERLGFYKTILGASKRAKGVAIQRFRILHEAHGWHYRLLLVQPFASNRWTYARVRLTVQGHASGHSSDTPVAGLVDTSRAVHFKYYAEVQGRLVLPVNIVPQRVVVQLMSGGHVVTQTYPWPVAASPAPRK